MSNLRDQLQEIYDKHEQLTPELVVEEARKKTHPLHTRFEWNNTAAADSWRKHQAAELIRSVRIVYREATENEQAKSVRAYHAVRSEDGHKYEPAEKVADDPFLKRLVLADMEREWKALHRRYSDFAEFVDMVKTDLEAAA